MRRGRGRRQHNWGAYGKPLLDWVTDTCDGNAEAVGVHRTAIARMIACARDGNIIGEPTGSLSWTGLPIPATATRREGMCRSFNRSTGTYLRRFEPGGFRSPPKNGNKQC
jgi:hypothetical protein